MFEVFGFLGPIVTFVQTILGWVVWLGIGLVPALICAAVVWFFPPLRKLAMFAGAAWILAFTAYTLGDSNGAERIHDEWKAAEERGINESNDARADAERTVEPAEPDVAPAKPVDGRPVPLPRRPVPRWMRDDKFNRDNR